MERLDHVEIGCCGYRFTYETTPHSLFLGFDSEEECNDFVKRAEEQIKLIHPSFKGGVPYVWSFKIPDQDQWLAGFHSESIARVVYTNHRNGKEVLKYSPASNSYTIASSWNPPDPLEKYTTAGYTEVTSTRTPNKYIPVAYFSTNLEQFQARFKGTKRAYEKYGYKTYKAALHYLGSPGTQAIEQYIRDNFNVLKVLDFHNPVYALTSKDPLLDGHHLRTFFFQEKT